MNIETSTTQSHSSKAMNDFIGLSPNKLTPTVTKSKAHRRLRSLISALKLDATFTTIKTIYYSFVIKLKVHTTQLQIKNPVHNW